MKGNAQLFAALGDGTRLTLVALLSKRGPLSVARLTEHTHVTRQAVSKHLRVMERAGMVRGTLRGRTRVWSLEAARLEAARRQIDRISQEWDSALSRLQRHVEQGRSASHRS